MRTQLFRIASQCVEDKDDTLCMSCFIWSSVLVIFLSVFHSSSFSAPSGFIRLFSSFYGFLFFSFHLILPYKVFTFFAAFFPFIFFCQGLNPFLQHFNLTLILPQFLILLYQFFFLVYSYFLFVLCFLLFKFLRMQVSNEKTSAFSRFLSFKFTKACKTMSLQSCRLLQTLSLQCNVLCTNILEPNVFSTSAIRYGYLNVLLVEHLLLSIKIIFHS